MKILKAELVDSRYITFGLITLFDECTKWTPEYEHRWKQSTKLESQIEESIRDLIQNEDGLCLIAEDENEFVGFTYGEIVQQEHIVFDKTPKIGLIKYIWINDKYRGRHIASMFKDKLHEWFSENECDYYQIDVLVENPAMKKYSHWGYVQVHTDMRLLP